MTKSSFLALLRAHCHTCNRVWNGKNAWAVAAKHARHHKHRTSVEVARVFVYDYTGEAENDDAIRESTSDQL